MSLDDRVGFACCFLSDADLVDYIKGLTETVYQSGDLTGMLLTGKCIVRASRRGKFQCCVGGVHYGGLLLQVQLRKVYHCCKSFSTTPVMYRLWV